MLSIKESLHNFFLDTDKKFYRNFYEYNPTYELQKIVSNYANKNTNYKDGYLWTQVYFDKNKLPKQGWKIHISATTDNYKDILCIVAKICIEKEIDFKFSSDTKLFLKINSKSIGRHISGKFITVYPNNTENFYEYLELFYEYLRDFEGPFILSDRRYKDCKVLYYRYGNFIKQSDLTYRGDKSTFLVSPSGEKIADNRASYWNLPYWVNDELYVEEEIKNKEFLLNNKYRVIKAISFTNSGGNYLVEDIVSKKKLFMKEARKNASMDRFGKDAVSRLRNEYSKLNCLKQYGISPKPVDIFEEWEHVFLVEELFENVTVLGPFVTNRNPLYRKDPSEQDINNYQELLRKIWSNILKAVVKIHEEGISFNDWSSNNILINIDTFEVKIIDFEAAYFVDVEEKIFLSTSGFVSKSLDNDFEEEIFKIGLTFLFTLLPINNLYDLDFNKPFDLLRKLKFDGLFSKSILFLLEDILNGKIKSVIELEKRVINLDFVKEEINDSIVYKNKNSVAQVTNSIFSSMELNSNSWLFPADPMVYMTNPLNVAYGSLGIIKILSDDKKLSKQQLDLLNRGLYWCLKKSIKENEFTAGLFTGASGIAWVLAELGISNGAELLKRFNSHYLLQESYDLFYGLAGNALTNLFVYKKTNDIYFLNEAIRKANLLMESAIEDGNGYFWEDSEDNTYVGYGRGSSGISLFFMYLYLETKEEKYLDFGERALQFDMNQMFYDEANDNYLTVSRGTIKDKAQPTSPYLYDGTAGIGIVMLRYYQITKKDEYYSYLKLMLNDCTREYTVLPSLMRGLSGIGHFLIDYYNVFKDPKILKSVNKIYDAIRMFEICDENGYISYPGEQLFRISHDLSTGTSGVLSFLRRIENNIEYNRNPIFMLDEFYMELMSKKGKDFNEKKMNLIDSY